VDDLLFLEAHEPTEFGKGMNKQPTIIKIWIMYYFGRLNMNNPKNLEQVLNKSYTVCYVTHRVWDQPKNNQIGNKFESITRVEIPKAKSNSCSIGFSKLICTLTVASENYYRFGPFDKEII
jgi:hypothetical protein